MEESSRRPNEDIRDPPGRAFSGSGSAFSSPRATPGSSQPNSSIRETLSPGLQIRYEDRSFHSTVRKPDRIGGEKSNSMDGNNLGMNYTGAMGANFLNIDTTDSRARGFTTLGGFDHRAPYLSTSNSDYPVESEIPSSPLNGVVHKIENRYDSPNSLSRNAVTASPDIMGLVSQLVNEQETGSSNARSTVTGIQNYHSGAGHDFHTYSNSSHQSQQSSSSTFFTLESQSQQNSNVGLFLGSSKDDQTLRSSMDSEITSSIESCSIGSSRFKDAQQQLQQQQQSYHSQAYNTDNNSILPGDWDGVGIISSSGNSSGDGQSDRSGNGIDGRPRLQSYQDFGLSSASVNGTDSAGHGFYLDATGFGGVSDDQLKANGGHHDQGSHVGSSAGVLYDYDNRGNNFRYTQNLNQSRYPIQSQQQQQQRNRKGSSNWDVRNSVSSSIDSVGGEYSLGQGGTSGGVSGSGLSGSRGSGLSGSGDGQLFAAEHSLSKYSSQYKHSDVDPRLQQQIYSSQVHRQQRYGQGNKIQGNALQMGRNTEDTMYISKGGRSIAQSYQQRKMEQQQGGRMTQHQQYENENNGIYPQNQQQRMPSRRSNEQLYMQHHHYHQHHHQQQQQQQQEQQQQGNMNSQVKGYNHQQQHQSSFHSNQQEPDTQMTPQQLSQDQHQVILSHGSYESLISGQGGIGHNNQGDSSYGLNSHPRVNNSHPNSRDRMISSDYLSIPAANGQAPVGVNGMGNPGMNAGNNPASCNRSRGSSGQAGGAGRDTSNGRRADSFQTDWDSSTESHDSLSRSGQALGSTESHDSLSRSGQALGREGKKAVQGGNRSRNASNTSDGTDAGSSRPQPPSRRELIESPATKSAYKEFYRALRAKEKSSVDEAEQFALESLSHIPENLKWRVYLELADLSKRRNSFDEARKFYKSACEIQPLATQGWLEWSKMEEECGKLRESLKILRHGLKMCNFNEGLLTKAIRQQERLHKLKDARGMLSVLKYESIEKVWRAVLEGALLEARAGRLSVARKVLKFLIQNVPWYGPIYYEAYKLEEKNNNLDSAISIVRKGLAELPRYGPLWFGLLKIVEKADFAAERFSFFYGRMPVLAGLKNEVASSVRVISRELMWKVHFEHSQAQERAADAAAAGLFAHASDIRSLVKARDELLGEARKALVRSVLACPSNLRWKVWLVGARLEINAGQIVRARRLLCQALCEAPLKSRASVYLECSRIEEYCGNVDAARKILQKACDEVRVEWKLFLESVLLEARCGNVHAALEVANLALVVHPGTGRLWAIYVQLCHRLECLAPTPTVGTIRATDAASHCSHPSYPNSHIPAADTEIADAFSITNATGQKYVVPSKQDILLRALRDVPKSGEVWTEGARCRLNPLQNTSFDVGGAQKFLGFAMQFTPQYGDTFIEVLRMELLTQIFIPRVLAVLGLPVGLFLSKFISFDMETDTGCLLSDHQSLYSLSARAVHAVKAMHLNNESMQNKQDSSAAAKISADEAELDFDHVGGEDEVLSLSAGDFMPSPAPALKEGLKASDLDFGSAEAGNMDGPEGARMRRLKNVIAMEQLEFDIGIKESDCDALILVNLIRRCINADPNYGVSWFFCRNNASDSPTAVINNALRVLIREMVLGSRIYVRAICHYIRDCYAKLLKHPGASNRDVMVNPNVRPVPAVSQQPPGTPGARESPVVVAEDSMYRQANTPPDSTTPKTPAFSFQAALQTSHGTSGEQIRRIEEFLHDFNVAGTLLGSQWTVLKQDPNDNVHKPPTTTHQISRFISSIPMVEVGGNVFTSTDFVTAIIVLNRLTFNRNLNTDERRKVLYGSDVILA